MTPQSAQLAWPTVAEHLRTAAELQEFLGTVGKETLQRIHPKPSVPRAWALDELFFSIEAWAGDDVGISLDPLGTYLKDARPCVWTIAGMWDFEKLKARLERGETFGSHLYFHWDTADDEWNFRMHPVSEIAAVPALFRSLEFDGNSISVDSCQFMEQMLYENHDRSRLRDRANSSIATAAAFLGLGR